MCPKNDSSNHTIISRLLKGKRKAGRVANKVTTGVAKLLPGSQSGNPKKKSFLVAENKKINREQREEEQRGHAFSAKLHAREHGDEATSSPVAEGELQNSIQQHPLLDTQRFDGIDINLNPEPPLNSVARTKYDNALREQQLEHQLKQQLALGNTPAFDSAPKPRPR